MVGRKQSADATVTRAMRVMRDITSRALMSRLASVLRDMPPHLARSEAEISLLLPIRSKPKLK